MIIMNSQTLSIFNIISNDRHILETNNQKNVIQYKNNLKFHLFFYKKRCIQKNRQSSNFNIKRFLINKINLMNFYQKNI